MNELQIFNNSEFREIRTVEIDGILWLVGKDVAEALGYERPTKAILDHVDDEDKDEVPIQDFIGRMQNTPVINKSGLYSLVLSSKLPGAKAFKCWVTKEVLPAIREQGAYITQKFNNIKQSLAEAKLNNSWARVSNMWLKIADKVSILEYRKICASYASNALTEAGIYNTYYICRITGTIFMVWIQTW